MYGSYSYETGYEDGYERGHRDGTHDLGSLTSQEKEKVIKSIRPLLEAYMDECATQEDPFREEGEKVICEVIDLIRSL